MSTGRTLLLIAVLSWIALVAEVADAADAPGVPAAAPAGAAAAADLAGATRAARDAAEHAAGEARLRIASEPAALIGQILTAVPPPTTARERLAESEHDAAAATDALAKRLKEQDHDLVLLKQLTDRALIAARLGETESRRLAGKPPLERLSAALAGIARRLQALPGRLALVIADEAVVGRQGGIATVPVLHLGEARAVALGADESHRGLLERAADGSSWLVVGPSLPPEVEPSHGTVALIALDAAGSAAHQVSEVHRTLAQWLKAGRFFIWPIIAVLTIGILVILERIIALARRRIDPQRLMRIALLMGDNNAAGAAALVAEGASPLDRVLSAGLKSLGKPRETREAAVEQCLLAETAQLTRGLPAIAVLAGVAPLLGLLGTVTGMIDMFSVIAAQGSGNAKSLSGGISEALICTQAGMLVAIPLLLAHAWLGRLAESRSHLLEEAACGVLGLSDGVESPGTVAAGLAAGAAPAAAGSAR
jgi:biopolymer transport protein ExbB